MIAPIHGVVMVMRMFYICCKIVVLLMNYGVGLFIVTSLLNLATGTYSSGLALIYGRRIHIVMLIEDCYLASCVYCVGRVETFMSSKMWCKKGEE